MPRWLKHGWIGKHFHQLMGCFQSTVRRQFPGHEDPVLLASQTACEWFLFPFLLVYFIFLFQNVYFRSEVWKVKCFVTFQYKAAFLCNYFCFICDFAQNCKSCHTFNDYFFVAWPPGHIFLMLTLWRYYPSYCSSKKKIFTPNHEFFQLSLMIDVARVPSFSVFSSICLMTSRTCMFDFWNCS